MNIISRNQKTSYEEMTLICIEKDKAIQKQHDIIDEFRANLDSAQKNLVEMKLTYDARVLELESALAQAEMKKNISEKKYNIFVRNIKETIERGHNLAVIINRIKEILPS